MSITPLVSTSRHGLLSSLRLTTHSIRCPPLAAIYTSCHRTNKLSFHTIPPKPNIAFPHISAIRRQRAIKPSLSYATSRRRRSSTVRQGQVQIAEDNFIEDPEPQTYNGEPIEEPSISSAVIYFLVFGSLAFSLAAYKSLTNTAEIAAKLEDPALLESLLSRYLKNFQGSLSAQDDFEEACWGPGITRAKLRTLHKLLQTDEIFTGVRILRNIALLPSAISEQLSWAYAALALKVVRLDDSHMAVVPIIFVNGIIYLLWARSGWSSRLGNFLLTNFIHRPSSNRTHTLLTSIFSHESFWHFGLNNFVLWSFGGSCIVFAAMHPETKLRVSNDIPESSMMPCFLAFFATAGVFASVTSHVYTALRFRSVAARSGLAAAQRTFGRHSYLGASGAIASVIVMTACMFPNNSVSIIFFPFFAIPIKAGVGALVALDVVGLVRGWQTFGHAAHLGGAFFGFAYYAYGTQFWAALKIRMAQLLRIGPFDPERRNAPVMD